MENYIVYKITNLINGKLYIGQTIRTLEERFKAHYYDDESNIGNAIRQYGRENFTIEVIEKCDSKEELNAYENYYIAYFDSKEPKGYNQIGGDIDAIDKYFERNLGKGWVALYQDSSLWLAKQNLTGEQFKVLFYMFNKLDFDNYLRISQKNISEELDIKQPHVSRAIRALEQREIIIEGPRAGLNKTYRLNPYVAHKGSRNYQENVIEFNEVIEGKRKAQKKNKKRIDHETGEIFED